MDRFWDLYEKSVVTSGLISLALVFTACYAALIGVELPSWFLMALTLVMGFFFSEKAYKASLNSKKEG